MKKFLCCLIMCSTILPSVSVMAEPNPMVQVLADEASKIGKEQGLQGEDLFDFIEKYISDNMPKEILEQEHEKYINSSYEEKLVKYNEWKEQFYVYSYNSIIVPQDVGFIVDRNIVNQNFASAFNGQSYSNDDSYTLKPIYDCITDFTLDGFIITKTFDNTYSLFSIETRDFIKTYDKKYDLSCGNIYNLLSFATKPVYDITDTENLRLISQEPYCIPAKDITTGKCGYINYMTGEVVIPFIYDDASYFNDGVAAVKKGDYWGYIDGKNNVILDFKYSKAGGFNKGVAQVDKSLIDIKGNVLVSTKNSTIYACGSDYYIGVSSLLNPFKNSTYLSIEVFDMNGNKLREKSIDAPSGLSNANDALAKMISNTSVQDYNYMGNGKLELIYKDTSKNIVVDLTK